MFKRVFRNLTSAFFSTKQKNVNSCSDVPASSGQNYPATVKQPSDDVCHGEVIEEAQISEPEIKSQAKINISLEQNTAISTQVEVNVQTSGRATATQVVVNTGDAATPTTSGQSIKVTVTTKPSSPDIFSETGYTGPGNSSCGLLLSGAVKSQIFQQADLWAEANAYEDSCHFDDGYGSDSWVSPTLSQVETYYKLRKTCESRGLPYNRRDIPESRRDYTLAIRALRQLLQQTTATIPKLAVVEQRVF